MLCHKFLCLKEIGQQESTCYFTNTVGLHYTVNSVVFCLKQEKKVVFVEEFHTVIEKIHREIGHFGIRKTYDRVSNPTTQYIFIL